MNAGKVFERAFVASVPKDVYVQRLDDPAASFGTALGTRFSPHQPYDFYAYVYPFFFAMELKSTLGSLTYWRKDFDEDGKKNTYEIKKWQIEGLDKASQHKGVIAGLYINFRKTEETYFLSIEDFHKLTDNMDKKSINRNDVAEYGVLIEQRKLKTNYRYNLRKFFDEIVASRQCSE